MINQLLSDLSDKLRSREIDKRELEHRLLQAIAVEIDEDQMDRATWLKAFSESEGNADKTKALYVKLRLQRLLDQIAFLEMQSRQKNVPQRKSEPLREQAIYAAPIERSDSLGFNLLLILCLLGSFAAFYFIFHVM